MCSNPGQEMIVAGHPGARARPGRGRRLQPAHARADLPQGAAERPGSTRTSSRWPTSASSAAGSTTTAAAATEKAKALTQRRGAAASRCHEPLERRSRRHVPEHARHRRRHRRHDRRAGAGRRRPAGLPRRARRPAWAATWPASTSRRPTSTRRATCSPSGSPACTRTRTSTSCSTPRSRASTGFVGNFNAAIRSTATTARRTDKTVDVGSVIVCTGYQEFDAGRDHALRLRQAAQRHHLLRVREDAARRAASRPSEGKAAAVRRHHPLRRQPQPGVPRLLLARLLHDGAQVRPRDQVAPSPTATSATSTSTCTPSGRGCEDFYRRSSEVKTLFLMYEQERPPGDPQGRPEGRLRHADRGQREALRRGDRDPGRPGRPDGRHGGARGRRRGRPAGQHQPGQGRLVHREPPQARPGGHHHRRRLHRRHLRRRPRTSPTPWPRRAPRRRASWRKIAKGKIEIDAVFAEVDEDRCSGCRMCNELCPYSAIEYDEEKQRSHVISAALQGVRRLRGRLPVRRHQGAPLHRRSRSSPQIEGVLA